MPDNGSPVRARHRRARRRGRPHLLVVGVAITAVAAATLLTYPMAASWLFAVNQTQVIDRYAVSVDEANPSAAEQLALARDYNSVLSSGAVLGANARIPEGSGTSSDTSLDYRSMLSTSTGVMARIRVPRISVDLPIYHGTSDDVLARGIGHLEGTSLPVGGPSTHAVLTGHRGLAEATLFSDLDRLVEGDTFMINTFGEVFTYRVIRTAVVEPQDTESLRQEEGEDLVTLVTCTPLGINTHRILVTGERVTPTPEGDVADATGPSQPAGFPWWLVFYVSALLGVGLYVAKSRRPAGDTGARAPRNPGMRSGGVALDAPE